MESTLTHSPTPMKSIFVLFEATGFPLRDISVRRMPGELIPAILPRVRRSFRDEALLRSQIHTVPSSRGPTTLSDPSELQSLRNPMPLTSLLCLFTPPACRL